MEIFVFGSNLAGIHGAGSALEAKRRWGAEQGVGYGRTGRAYAIPTKNTQLKTMSLALIKPYVDDFVLYADWNRDMTFRVVEIGCGLAGYTPEKIAPMFEHCTSNVSLPLSFRTVLDI